MSPRTIPMQALPCLALFLALPLGMALSLRGAHANTGLMKTLSHDTLLQTKQLSIQYDQGLLSARILNVPVAEMCRELVRKTGVRCVPSPPAATLGVSAIFKGLALQEGIKKILAGCSYVIYPAGETGELEIKVLNSSEDREWKDRGREEWHVIGSERSEPAFQSAGMPQPYEESHSVEMEFDQEAQSVGEWNMTEHEHEEALLQNALNTLNSGDGQLRTDTLTLLQGIDDPRATELLVEAALTSKKDNQAQVRAVEILSQHAVILGYRDEASVNALKQLADDSDSQAAEVARQALEQYTQHSAAP
jgi:hypothetical protein